MGNNKQVNLHNSPNQGQINESNCNYPNRSSPSDSTSCWTNLKHTKMKLVILNGSIYALIAAATPWAQFLGSTQEVTNRMIAATAVASIVAGATALKAFLSTSNIPTK